ncbi:MAG: ABC transporter permease [Acidimicrobiales bacterium]
MPTSHVSRSNQDGGAITHLREISAARDLWTHLTLRELRGKYKRSVLGWAWSLLNPIAMMLVYTLVFRYLLKIQVTPGDPSGLDVFPLFLLCGLLPWNYLSNSMFGGMGGLVGNANLVKKVYFPREILVGSNVASWTFSLGIELGVLILALLVAGNMVLPWILPLLVLVALQTAFVLGVALALSVLNVYFRDVQHLLGIFMQLWFYATPIIYPISLVAEADARNSLPLLRIYRLNPMARFVEAYRDVLYDLRFPPAEDLLFLGVISAIVLVVGYAIFYRLEPRLAEEL